MDFQMVVKVCDSPVALGLGTGQRFSYHSREVEEMQKVRKSIFFVTICQMAVLRF